MEEKNKKEQTMFIAYEYKDLNVKKELASFYLDCYENFG